MKKGVAISPGVVVAQAFRMDEALARRAAEPLEPGAAAAESARLDRACEVAARELDAIIERVAREVDEDAANIFRAHRLLLRDPALIAKVKGFIVNQHVNAPTALQMALDEYSALFARIPDEYLRERVTDIRDVVGRVMSHLTIETSAKQLEGHAPVILVAPEILPSHAVMFDRLPVAGIVTETGGSTGHAALLARSLGIPAVSGIRNLLREVHTGDLLIVDGREGVVLLNPGPEVESAYRKMQREYVNLRDRLVENRDQEAVTADGVKITLLANVNNVLDAAAAVGVGAEGVGLFRSEFTFLTHPTVPSEEEQIAAYRAVIEASPNGVVTMRTLDLGGDKQVPYLGSHREANPFMGWRSIRMTSEYPEFFQTQLKAILRSAAHGRVSVLFPMISTLDEVRRLRRLIDNTRMGLKRAKVPFGEEVPFGIMVEVPAAALCIDDLLEEVDFVSVGSNDLIQYIMAADRDNPKVAHLCEPFQPAVFRLLKPVIEACAARGKPITLCGEMAARPGCLLALIGMGMRRFSMSPAFVPTAKELVRSLKLPMAERAAEQVVRMKTAGEVRDHLVRNVKKACPKAYKLDTK